MLNLLLNDKNHCQNFLHHQRSTTQNSKKIAMAMCALFSVTLTACKNNSQNSKASQATPPPPSAASAPKQLPAEDKTQGAKANAAAAEKAAKQAEINAWKTEVKTKYEMDVDADTPLLSSSSRVLQSAKLMTEYFAKKGPEQGIKINEVIVRDTMLLNPVPGKAVINPDFSSVNPEQAAQMYMDHLIALKRFKELEVDFQTSYAIDTSMTFDLFHELNQANDLVLKLQKQYPEIKSYSLGDKDEFYFNQTAAGTWSIRLPIPFNESEVLKTIHRRAAIYRKTRIPVSSGSTTDRPGYSEYDTCLDLIMPALDPQSSLPIEGIQCGSPDSSTFFSVRTGYDKTGLEVVVQASASQGEIESAFRIVRYAASIGSSIGIVPSVTVTNGNKISDFELVLKTVYEMREQLHADRFFIRDIWVNAAEDCKLNRDHTSFGVGLCAKAKQEDVRRLFYDPQGKPIPWKPQTPGVPHIFPLSSIEDIWG